MVSWLKGTAPHGQETKLLETEAVGRITSDVSKERATAALCLLLLSSSEPQPGMVSPTVEGGFPHQLK